jgi:hypothetical protein
MTVREFRAMIEAGEFDRERLHAGIGKVIADLKTSASQSKRPESERIHDATDTSQEK